VRSHFWRTLSFSVGPVDKEKDRAQVPGLDVKECVAGGQQCVRYVNANWRVCRKRRTAGSRSKPMAIS